MDCYKFHPPAEKFKSTKVARFSLKFPQISVHGQFKILMNQKNRLIDTKIVNLAHIVFWRLKLSIRRR